MPYVSKSLSVKTAGTDSVPSSSLFKPGFQPSVKSKIPFALLSMPVETTISYRPRFAIILQRFVILLSRALPVNLLAFRSIASIFEITHGKSK